MQQKLTYKSVFVAFITTYISTHTEGINAFCMGGNICRNYYQLLCITIITMNYPLNQFCSH